MITVVDQSRVTADLGSRFSAANRAANKFTVIHEELSSRLTTGNVEGHAVNIASSITEEERHGIGNLAELAGAAQWRSTGLGIALPKLLNGNAAGVGQRCFIGQRPPRGCPSCPAPWPMWPRPARTAGLHIDTAYHHRQQRPAGDCFLPTDLSDILPYYHSHREVHCVL